MARSRQFLLVQRSLFLTISQVFAPPLVIYLIMARRYRVTALASAIVTRVHFAPCSWLYPSSLHLALAPVLPIGLFIVCRLIDGRGGDPHVVAVLTAGSVVARILWRRERRGPALGGTHIGHPLQHAVLALSFGYHSVIFVTV